MSHGCARVVLASALVAASLVAAPAAANRFRDNPKHVVDRAKETWTSPIGELERDITPNKNGQGGETATVGTAFLVSPCYIMTAAHVVYGHDYSPVPGKDYRMTFRAGISGASPFAGHTTATPIVSGEYDSASRNDWTLMRLHNCIGGRPEFGWLDSSVRPEKELLGIPAAAVGYPIDADRGLMSLGEGHLHDRDSYNGQLRFDGSFGPGSSGGPVLVTENASIVVAAIISGDMGSALDRTYDRYRLDVANTVQPIRHALSERLDVKALLDADKASFGQPNPAANRLRMDHLPR